MTATERSVFNKLLKFTALIRNRAPIRLLRSAGVAMSELIEGILQPKHLRDNTIGGEDIVTARLSNEWETI